MHIPNEVNHWKFENFEYLIDDLNKLIGWHIIGLHWMVRDAQYMNVSTIEMSRMGGTLPSLDFVTRMCSIWWFLQRIKTFSMVKIFFEWRYNFAFYPSLGINSLNLIIMIGGLNLTTRMSAIQLELWTKFLTIGVHFKDPLNGSTCMVNIWDLLVES
jgi:hypothetical protein